MASAAANPTSTGPLRAGRYRVDPNRTRIRLGARHMFGLGRVSGTVSLRHAALIVGEPATATTLRAVVDANSFDTGNDRRDAAVRSGKYLDSAGYPDITFGCEGIRRDAESWVASGTVTARGVSAPVDVRVEQADELDGELRLRANAKIDRYAHGVTAGKGLAGRWITLDISATCTPDHTTG